MRTPGLGIAHCLDLAARVSKVLLLPIAAYKSSTFLLFIRVGSDFKTMHRVGKF